jgi:hypothetical protein
MGMEKEKFERVREIVEVMGKIEHIVCDTILQCRGDHCGMGCQLGFANQARG